MTKKFFKWCITALLTLAPLILTLVVVFKVLQIAEFIFSSVLRAVLGEKLYYPGMGMITTFIVLALCGYLLEKHNFFRRIFSRFSGLIEKIPGARAIYNFVKNIISLFGSSKKGEFSETVLVKFGDGRYEIGLVTCKDFTGIMPEIAEIEGGLIGIVFPWAFQFAGRPVLIPESMIVKRLKMSPEEALRMVFTGFILLDKNEK
ncbi:MAG: DUF502 domain-containing protein [Candidatus Nanoarchaeia archaeon]|nr:DUF502 domain-containing protein [Candidatus Nanoarchaeia archaeon]MDD5741553.1 DUF502 domain-containing protein [Candidatus Nanoarchaeia archaeon]